MPAYYFGLMATIISGYKLSFEEPKDLAGINISDFE